MDPEGRLTDFEDFLEKMMSYPKSDHIADTLYIIEQFFGFIYTDKDGEISENEFAVFFQAYSIPEEWAQDFFNYLDTDKDGEISKEEFITAGINYFTLETEGNGSDYLWRPLVK